MSKRDYYEVLGVSKDASDADIKKAYRKKALQYHPDKTKGDASSEEKFKEANEAYEVLSDPEKKEKYDRFGHAGVDPNAGYGQGGSGFGGFGGGGFDFSDIFDMFGGGSSARRRNGPRKGSDVQIRVPVTFEEAAFGTKKSIKVTRTEKCDVCHGSGAEPGTNKKECPVCHGQGEVHTVQRTPFGQFQNVKTCDHCHGTGQIIEEPCKACRGSGRARKQTTLSVNIPAGVDNDSVISLRGEGEVGINGGPNGDLYVIISMASHKLFTRDGYNLMLDIPITYSQACLGAEVVVPTLSEKIMYKVPAGTQNGTTFRIKGKGIKHINSSRTGDLYVKVLVEIPTKLNKEQKELLKQLGETFDKGEHSKRKGFLDNVKNMFS